MVALSKTEKSSVICKNRSVAGESIGEVLVATLISSLGLLMLAMMISTASRMVTNSQSVMDNYIEDEMAIVIADSEKCRTENGTLKFTNSGIERTLVRSGEDLSVTYYQTRKVGGKAVTTYKKRISGSP